MATRPDLIPPEAELELFAADPAQAEVNRIDQVAALERALDTGEQLEVDLVQSGFYGGEPVTPDDPDVAGELARRSLGDLLIRVREMAVDDRWGFDEQTMLNFAFRFGHHYVEVDPARRAIVPLPAPRNAVRRKINKFEPWFRAQHGRLSSAIPTYHVRPKNRQRQDRDASEFAEELAEWLVPKFASHDNRAEAVMWLLLSGMYITYCGIEWDEADDYMVAADGMPVPRPELVDEILAPMACWADNRISRIEHMRWFGIDRYVPIAEAKARYPDSIDKLDPVLPGFDQRGHSVMRRIQKLHGREDPWTDRFQNREAGHLNVEEEAEVIICEYWGVEGLVLECRWLDRLDPQLVPFEVIIDSDSTHGAIVRFPAGLRVEFTTEGHVLSVGTNPNGRLPFKESKFSKTPGFWPVAPATFLREVQQAINWLVSMREMHLLKVGQTPLLEPIDARVRRRGFLQGATQRIRYRANRFGAKPELMQLPNMPSDSVQFWDALERVWQDLAAQHDVSLAQLPSSDTSGVAIGLLQEKDVEQLGFAGSEIEETFIEILRRKLIYIQKFFPQNDPRLLQLAGDAPYRLEAFMMSDLDNGLDLQCVKGSSIPKSPAVVEQKAIEMWREGALVDEFGMPDHRRLLQIYQFGTEDELYAEEMIDVQNARAEEAVILSMPPDIAIMLVESFMVAMTDPMTGEEMPPLPPEIMPKPEEDKLVHEREHRLTLKRLRSDERIHPANLQLLELHWQLTVPAVAAAMGLGGAPQEDDPGQDAGAEE